MEDFPRGGANALTPLEVRKIKETATQDVLFGVSMEENFLKVEHSFLMCSSVQTLSQMGNVAQSGNAIQIH